MTNDMAPFLISYSVYFQEIEKQDVSTTSKRQKETLRIRIRRASSST